MDLPPPLPLAASVFTCISCCASFSDSAAQREHYRCDWHRYNLRRKVASLAPVSNDDFLRRAARLGTLPLLSSAATENDEGAAAMAPGIRPRPASLECRPCGKRFSSANAMRTHVESKKHSLRTALSNASESKHGESANAGETAAAVDTAECDDNVATLGEGLDITAGREGPSGDSIATTYKARKAAAKDLTPLDCLFCNAKFGCFDGTLEHMHSEHSFVFPCAERLADREGLFRYLASKICLGLACLQCHTPEAPRTGLFRSLDAVRKHMLDKGHVTIPESDPVVPHFYNEPADGKYLSLRSMYYQPKVRNVVEDDDVGTAKNKNKDTIARTVPTGTEKTSDSDIEEEEEEYDSEDSDIDGDDDWSSDFESSDDNVEDEPQLEVDETFQLVLPNGKILGHRAYKNYFKQNLNKDSSFASALLALEGLTDDEKAKVLKALKREKKNENSVAKISTPETRELVRCQRRERKRQLYEILKTSVRANKLQTYFRPQVLF